MNEQMFCFQCEQTAGCRACMGKAGVCGKPAPVAEAQDRLTGAMITLAQAAEAKGATDARVTDLLVRSLFTTVTNVNFNEATVDALTDEAHTLGRECGAEADGSMARL